MNEGKNDRRRWLWPAIGAAMSLLAVDGRWDIPLAAWLFAVFLLRFTRTSRLLAGLVLVWLVSAYGLLASTQDGNLALLQVISVVGPYSIGFLIGAFATVVNWAWAHPLARRTARMVGAYALVVVVVTVAGAARLAWFPADTAQTVRVAGINPRMALLGSEMTALGELHVDAATVGRLGQAAIPRFDPDTVRAESTAVIDGLFADTRRATQAGAKIVVWSENAARISAAGEATFVAWAQDVAKQEHIYLDIADNVHLPDPVPRPRRDTLDRTRRQSAVDLPEDPPRSRHGELHAW